MCYSFINVGQIGSTKCHGKCEHIFVDLICGTHKRRRRMCYCCFINVGQIGSTKCHGKCAHILVDLICGTHKTETADVFSISYFTECCRTNLCPHKRFRLLCAECCRSDLCHHKMFRTALQGFVNFILLVAGLLGYTALFVGLRFHARPGGGLLLALLWCCVRSDGLFLSLLLVMVLLFFGQAGASGI